MGIAAAVGGSLARAEPGTGNEPLASLLAHASWNGDLSLTFNLATFNRPAFLAIVKPDVPELDRLDAARGQERWWTWAGDPIDDAPRPTWWHVPVAFVVSIRLPPVDFSLTEPLQPRPVAMHTSDLADMHRQAMHLAGELDRIVLSKARMTETLTEHVAELERDLYAVA